MKRQIAHQTPYFGPNVENFVAQRADLHTTHAFAPPRPHPMGPIPSHRIRRRRHESIATRRGRGRREEATGERSRGREGEETEDTEYVRLDVHRDDHRVDELDDDDVDARARGIRETDRARARGSIDG